MEPSSEVRLDQYLRLNAGLVCLAFGIGSGLLAGCEGSAPSASDPEVATSTETESTALPTSNEDVVVDAPRTVEDSLAENCEPGEADTFKTWHGGIERVLHEKCMVCHGDEPLYGAPFSHRRQVSYLPA